MKLEKICLAVGIVAAGGFLYSVYQLWKGMKVEVAPPFQNFMTKVFLPMERLSLAPKAKKLFREMKIKDTPLFVKNCKNAQDFLAFYQQRAVLTYHHNQALLDWLDFDPYKLSNEQIKRKHLSIEFLEDSELITVNPTITRFQQDGDMSKVILG